MAKQSTFNEIFMLIPGKACYFILYIFFLFRWWFHLRMLSSTQHSTHSLMDGENCSCSTVCFYPNKNLDDSLKIPTSNIHFSPKKTLCRHNVVCRVSILSILHLPPKILNGDNPKTSKVYSSFEFKSSRKDKILNFSWKPFEFNPICVQTTFHNIK
jgi:hypothetical protein